MANNLPPASEVLQHAESAADIQRIGFETHGITAWDSGLVTFLTKIINHCTAHKIQLDQAGLPNGVKKLLHLAYAVPERKGARRSAQGVPLLPRIGSGAIRAVQATAEMLGFLGEAAMAFGRLFIGKARYRHSDLALLIQEVGAQALPIVTLISFLVGLILAFVGAVQLQQFGAQIYVADLVGLGMTREMGAMMTGIIMAGRTGAAFAAQLGTMTVNEEIDALKTMGISPMDFLVLPRMLALVLMMPLLCLYADVMGILGGFFVGVSMLDLEARQYLSETREALTLTEFSLGLIKSSVYGVLVAIAGCMRGMQCGRSAAAVGSATTSAVVTAIVLIVVASAILTVIYDVLGF